MGNLQRPLTLRLSDVVRYSHKQPSGLLSEQSTSAGAETSCLILQSVWVSDLR